MKKQLIPSLCFLLITFLASCGSDKQEGAETDNGATSVAAIDSTLTSERQEHFLTAARNIMLQAELAQMALNKTETQNAKAYGQDLANWANTKQQELQEMAARYNIQLPQEMEKKQLKHIRDVEEEKVKEEKAYKYDLELWDSMKDAQKDAIEDFDKALKDVSETDATAFTLWSRNTEKELYAHLKQAAAYELELKNREGGIAKPILEGMNQ